MNQAMILYRDGLHLTGSFARSLAPTVTARLRLALAPTSSP